MAVLTARAEAALAAGNPDEAVSAYEEALARTPWNASIERSLVAAYVERARRSRARPGGPAGAATAAADLRRAREHAPGDPEVARSLAAILLDQALFEAEPARAEALRAEAAALAPALAAAAPVLELSVERRLDVAYELIEQGQLDSGIDALDSLVRDQPGKPAAIRLLAQALVRKGGAQTKRLDHRGAAQSFRRAVEFYAQLAPCDGARCDAAEFALAHRNRIVSLLDGQKPAEARAALAEAEALGLRFEDLRRGWSELN